MNHPQRFNDDERNALALANVFLEDDCIVALTWDGAMIECMDTTDRGDFPYYVSSVVQMWKRHVMCSAQVMANRCPDTLLCAGHMMVAMAKEAHARDRAMTANDMHLTAKSDRRRGRVEG